MFHSKVHITIPIKICLLFLSHTTFFSKHDYVYLLINSALTLSLDHQLYFSSIILSDAVEYGSAMCAIVVVYMKRMFEMHAVLPCDIMPDMWIKDIS